MINMAKKKVISEKFSMTGWDLKIWLKKNWKTIKEILKWVAAPGALATLGVTNPTVIAVVAPLSKAALDIGEYYITQQTE